MNDSVLICNIKFIFSSSTHPFSFPRYVFFSQCFADLDMSPVSYPCFMSFVFYHFTDILYSDSCFSSPDTAPCLLFPLTSTCPSCSSHRLHEAPEQRVQQHQLPRLAHAARQRQVDVVGGRRHQHGSG